ncbi:ubiquitin carboxyl-terminal hydrolase domain-containing protein [Hirsutella rhossiliensis]|uniref:Ubiquitin carboxyl-terminal hydrolase domain-containing protein n=1 Tax=Hirsutella rhossiliensis TaxID=111463 RepID=A0A9P8MYD1_9HYPO|nr:ubiquitin carboxyl-terminal hydrolase domain-containing protein [Hirsutella rhossiliensis]KAH0963587.1 ubiquitin carboxyl-terminal hydrolase domain-containing protein [Hirsutella rhossiliensis]
MDSASTPTTAADPQQEAADPEPPFARPNPFDDTDLSRKRRRTSVSASPAASLDTANLALEAPTLAAAHLVRPASISAMSVDDSPDPPRTPNQHNPRAGSPTEPPSSKVTINLRRRTGSESSTAALVPSVPPSDAHPMIPDLNALGETTEAPETAMENARESGSRSPGSSSLSTSPPIELIAVADSDDRDNDDMNCAPTSPDIAGRDWLQLDPTTHFPYTEPEESLCDTLQRLTQYLSTTDTPIDPTILGQVVEWLDEYLKFTKRADTSTVLTSRRTHKGFWFSFPEIILALTSRKPDLIKVAILRSPILNLYTGFAALTARFVALDCLAVRETQAIPLGRRGPDLLSPLYLQQLHGLIASHGFPPHLANDGSHAAVWAQQDVELYLTNKFQTSPGGGIDYLSQFASALVGLVPQFPRLADSFAPDDAAQARKRLEQGHAAWAIISVSLMAAIDKHVTSLNGDHAASSIQALTEVLKVCLQGDHKEAIDVLDAHREKYPALASKHAHEAVAWQWKVDILEKLIRSSQMQLRVMAVTTMCTHLVAVWKRLCDGGEEYSAEFLDHLAGYLLNTGLIDYILGASCHPEIIVESANIVGFLVVTRTYRSEHTDRVWHGITSSQDPRVVDALTRMMTNITNLFDYAGLLHLCNKFQPLPVEGFSPSIRLLLDNVLSEMMARAQTNQSTLTFHPYGLCLRLLRESSVCASGSQVADPDMQQVAMQKSRELLGHGPDAEGRRELYLSCINDISAKSATTLGSLWCLSMAIRHATEGQMQVLTEQHDLAKLIVEELEHAGNAGRSAGVFPVLSGTSNQPRRDFVANLIQLQPAAIDNDLGTKLWNILVGPQSTCAEDRKAGWYVILSVARKATLQNAFLRTCFSEHLPRLPAGYFCEGMLEFVKERVRLLLEENPRDFVLDDEAIVARYGIEHLWRIILEAQDSGLVAQAISILAVDVYLESKAIMSYPLHRTRQVHLALVNRCLRQMKDTASKLRRSSDGTTSGDDEPMIIVATPEETKQQELIFTRSLQLLRFFLEKYQSKPKFAVADLRSFMSETPQQIEGDSARLRYQSFDGDEQTDIMPLSIGKLNTVSSLLASLRQETGFDNYRVYYRGHQLLLVEQDISKSLQELDIQDGFMLVKREDNYSASPVRIKPGSLPLEIEILAHFPELWDYLSMDEQTAEEIYDFVIRLPADGYILSRFDTNSTSYKDLFLPGQPFKSLYAIHALSEYIEGACRATSSGNPGSTPQRRDLQSSQEAALRRSLHLVVQALSDPEVLEGSVTRLQIRVVSSLMQKFVQLVQVDSPTPERLIEVLSDALDYPDNGAIPLIASTCSAILLVGKLDARFWIKITESNDFRGLIQKLVLFEPRREVRVAVVELLEVSAEAEAQVPQTQPAKFATSEVREPSLLAKYLWPIVSNLLPEAVERTAQCDELFRLLKKLLLLMSNTLPGQSQFDQLTRQTNELLLEHDSTEDVSQIEPYDPVANGLASVLHLCLQIDASLPASRALPEDTARDLFWRHLFPQKLSPGADSVRHVVLNTETRAKLYEVIFRLVGHDGRQFGQTLHLLNELVPFYSEDTDEPYLYDLPYQFDRSKAMRSPCGYVGLRNLSNTCYLNSLLTQLYMNTEFRRFMLGASCRGPTSSQQLLFHTQKVFGFMQESYRRYVDPSSLVGSIKTYEDTVIDIHSQMDVDEFYSLLFDRWEGQISRPEDKRRLRSFYGGQLVQQVKSKECEHISERLEPFSAIQCDIKGKGTLEESLQAYVDGEIMEGDNKYKCSTCDRHVDAVKRACLKDVPDNVMFHLKRFDFNLRTLQRSKINDHFSFPPTIDLRPYTIEHLSDTSSEAAEDVFELVGILVHSGTAESGHYYSYIKERPSAAKESWIEFNDDVVTPWDPSLMSYSAYMLFYQRVSSLKTEQESMVAQQLSAPLRVDMPALLKEHIANENTVILRRHCVFDPGHAIFVQNCFTRARSVDRGEANSPTAAKENLAMEMALSHLDQIVSRTKDTPFFAAFSSTIRAAVVSCPRCALALYDYFDARHTSYRALVQRNPEQHVRAFAGEVLVRAAEKIAERLPDVDGEGMERDLEHDGEGGSEHSVLEGVAMLFNHLWQFFQIHLRSWDEYFGTILAFAKLGHREAGLVLSEDYLIKLLRIVDADTTMDLPPNYARMLNNVLRRINTRPPSYSAIMSLIDYLLAQLDPVLGPEVIIDQPGGSASRSKLPFPWTSQEVHEVHNHPDRQMASFFVEKLVSIDQAWSVTNDIVGRLILTGGPMDLRIVNTLCNNIQGELSTQPMDPFLRVAGRYLECTQSADNAHALIRHVCAQARNLQNTEGAAFLNFIRVALRSDRPDEELARSRRESSIDTVTGWAPYLLVYPDANTRREAEQLLEDEVLQHSSLKEAGENENGTENRERFDRVVRDLGIKCLVYLREVHTRRRIKIERDAAWSILRVVGRCAPCYEGVLDADGDEDVEFAALQGEVMEPLRRLMVDEVEDEASDWDESCVSSDPMEANVGIPV